ncbi:MAG: hypothetical protein WBP26_04070 [Candidatus Saccharimonadales bacterium]
MGPGSDQHARLLASVAEQLRVLLLQVARTSELSEYGDLTSEQLAHLKRNSQIGLQLVDHYLLGLSYSSKQIQLRLEPVSMSALLHEVAHELDKIAKNYATDLLLHVDGKYPPVMGDRSALKAAVASLGYGLISASDSVTTRRTVQLAVHRTPHGVVAGVYGEELLLSRDIHRGRMLYGMASQPLANHTAASGAGIFVADSLFQAMGTSLRSSKFQKRYGLGATFQISGQTQLV